MARCNGVSYLLRYRDPFDREMLVVDLAARDPSRGLWRVCLSVCVPALRAASGVALPLAPALGPAPRERPRGGAQSGHTQTDTHARHAHTPQPHS